MWTEVWVSLGGVEALLAPPQNRSQIRSYQNRAQIRFYQNLFCRGSSENVPVQNKTLWEDQSLDLMSFNNFIIKLLLSEVMWSQEENPVPQFQNLVRHRIRTRTRTSSAGLKPKSKQTFLLNLFIFCWTNKSSDFKMMNCSIQWQRFSSDDRLKLRNRPRLGSGADPGSGTRPVQTRSPWEKQETSREEVT